MSGQGIVIGARVRVSAGVGVVRYVGTTSFAAGKWVGIELDTPTGKNDGTVLGVRYFDCDHDGPGYGVFVKPSSVTVLDGAAAAVQQQPSSRSASALSRSSASVTSSRAPSVLATTATTTTAATGPRLRARTPSAQEVTPTAQTDEEQPVRAATTSTRTEPGDPFSLATKPATVPKREHDDLLTKLRILESRRADDRERLKELERLREEADEWSKLKDRSKSRIAELGAEVKELRKQNKELTASLTDSTTKYSDLSDQIELTLLDKEVAEEKFESIEADHAKAKDRIAELELENTMLKEQVDAQEDADAQGGSTRDDAQWRKLERQNARLKEALIQLRDTSNSEVDDLKRRVHDLEKELELTGDLQALFENQAVELSRAESQIEELKASLDDALGAEDMLEDLTERNLVLTERIEEMKATIEDLEALKELNDELEDSHIANEKELHAELDARESQVREWQQRCDALEEGISEYEQTTNQFRELVATLQYDLETLRSAHADAETTSANLSSQSQAIMNLNLRLKSTVAKSQIKAIEIELRRIEAAQAKEHLAIVSHYLPTAYRQTDALAVEAILFFDRLAAKADLVSHTVEQSAHFEESLASTVPESLIAKCELRTKLCRYSSCTKRFARASQHSSTDFFLATAGIHREMSSAEKRFDHFIELQRREELLDVDASDEVDRLTSQVEHLIETNLKRASLDLPEREAALFGAVDLDLDTIVASAGFVKQIIATSARSPEVSVETGDSSLEESIYKPVQALIDTARSAKMTSRKLVRKLDELIAGSSVLRANHLQGIETLGHNASAIAGAIAKLARQLREHLSTVTTAKEALKLSSLLGIATSVAEAELGKRTAKPFGDVAALVSQLAHDLQTTLTTLSDESQIEKFSFEPPWIARVKQIEQENAASVEAQSQVAKLQEQVRDLARAVREKEVSHDEASVKVELLQKRLDQSQQTVEGLRALEVELHKSRKNEKQYEQAIEALQADLDRTEAELAKARAVAPTDEGRANATDLAYEGSFETSRLLEQIEALRSTVSFLRAELGAIQSADFLDSLRPIGRPLAARDVSRPGKATPGQRHELERLIKEVRTITATPQLVDLTLSSSLAADDKKVKPWTIEANKPASQLRREKERIARVARKVERFAELQTLTSIVV